MYWEIPQGSILNVQGLNCSIPPEGFVWNIVTRQLEQRDIYRRSDNPEDQYSFIKKANDRGYEVLHIDGPLAPHWISLMEQSFENCSFARVDSDTLDKLIQKTDEIPSKL